MNKLAKIMGISLILSGLLLIIGCEDKKADEDHGEITVTLKILQNDVEVTTVAVDVEAELIFEVVESDGHDDDHGTHVSGLSPHMEIGGHDSSGEEVDMHTGMEDGHYEGHHTFTEAGDYEVHFSYHYEDMDMEEHFDLTCE